MAVSVKKETFVAHGKEFDTKAEAERYDKLQKARQEYEDAGYKLQSLLAETQRTADGQVFEFGIFRDYYAVTRFCGFPTLQRLTFMCRNWEVQEDEFGVNIRDGGRQDNRFYPIGDLYADERNAQKALAHAQFKELAELTEQTNKLRESVNFPLLKAPDERV